MSVAEIQKLKIELARSAADRERQRHELRVESLIKETALFAKKRQLRSPD